MRNSLTIQDLQGEMGFVKAKNSLTNYFSSFFFIRLFCTLSLIARLGAFQGTVAGALPNQTVSTFDNVTSAFSFCLNLIKGLFGYDGGMAPDCLVHRVGNRFVNLSPGVGKTNAISLEDGRIPGIFVIAQHSVSTSFAGYPQGCTLGLPFGKHPDRA